ncbi:MAG: hypothetical protein DME25_19745, partial [Verrucomicrobia bacterium]
MPESSVTSGTTGVNTATPPSPCVLTINSGSSSIKFALFPVESPATRLLSGKVERIGLPDPVVTIKDGPAKIEKLPIPAGDHLAAGGFLLDWLAEHLDGKAIVGVGHRVVHGGVNYTRSQRVTRQMVEELNHLSPYDP